MVLLFVLGSVVLALGQIEYQITYLLTYKQLLIYNCVTNTETYYIYTNFVYLYIVCV
jgi:hypothetical protein